MSYWIESTSDAARIHYICAGSQTYPWEWTDDPLKATAFATAEIATRFFQRLGHSGVGLRVRRTQWSKLNGA